MFGSKFATPRKIVIHAFDTVTKDIIAPAKAMKAFKNEYIDAHLSGDSRAEQAAAVDNLYEEEWKWPEFDRWMEKFKSKKVFPEGWKYLNLDSEFIEPSTVKQHLALLSIKKIRELVKSKAFKIPSKYKRDEVIAYASVHFELDEIAQFTVDEVEDKQISHEAYIAEGKCKLLSGHISATAYSLRDAAKRKDLSIKHKLRAVGSGCPVSDILVRKFNRGEITALPPYFPGDGIGVVTEFE